MKIFSLGLLLALLLTHLGTSSYAQSELLLFTDRLVAQIQSALQNASFSFFALTAGDAQWHAQSVINLLEGPASSRYDPKYGAQTADVGAVALAKQLAEQINKSEFANDLRAAADHVVVFLSAAQERAISARNNNNLAQIRAQMQLAIGFLKAALGCPDDTLSLGGARTIQEYLRKRRV